MVDQVKSLSIESWTLYPIALLFVAARMYVNSSVYETLTPKEVQNAVYGSKFVFIAEEFKLSTVWLIKACLLMLYNHMTKGLPKQQRMVKLVGVYCAIGKLVLCVVFSLGIFVILSAVLNRYYNFTAGYGSLIYLNWYAGETSTAMIVGNVPHCWPILSRIFRLGSFKSTRGPASGNKFVLSSNTNSRRRPSDMDMNGYLRSESEERIANKGATAGFGFRNSQSQEAAMELGEIDKGTYTTTVAAERDEQPWGRSRSLQYKDEKDRIVKTVQLHQYTE
ncbi:hypothetical protein ACLMJK_004987 [Lecanora helva]